MYLKEEIEREIGQFCLLEFYQMDIYFVRFQLLFVHPVERRMKGNILDRKIGGKTVLKFN